MWPSYMPLLIFLASFLFLLFPFSSALGQDTISVDAVSAMHVCKSSAEAGPCATAPRRLSNQSPSYPEKARWEHKEGTVTLDLIVAKNGSVNDIRVVKGVDKDIDQSAVDAVTQWKFFPGTFQGNPVDVELTVTVNFQLSANAQQPASSENLQQKEETANDVRNTYSDAVESFNRGDYATAANLLRKITATTPQNGNAWNELGRALLAMNELDAAAQAFETSIDKDPGSRNAYNNLGLVYWRQRKYEEAAAQFRKQMVVNPDDHYAHRNLGLMLRDQHRCSDAMPELQKALSLTPNYAEALLAEGECDLDLSNRAKGISELQQAISVSSAPNTFNSAAYVLANHNIEIDMAAKWSDACLSMENTRLQNISLDHLTPEQLNYVFWMAAYWDTRGWIYFLQGDNTHARSYVEAAWSLRADPSIGDHLGRIYEKLGRSQDATKMYAMAVASADLPTRAKLASEDLADAKKQLARLAEGNMDRSVKQARNDLSGKNVVVVPNEGSLSAAADFNVRISESGKSAEFYQVNGDKALAKFAGPLQTMKLPVAIPESSAVEIPLRGTLTCHAEEAQCRFAFLSPEEAVNIVRNEIALASATPGTVASHDPHTYEDPAIGMRVSLPDEWRLLRLEPGSFSRPRNAMFGKSGSLAMFMLTRERFEGSSDLYLKTLNTYFSTKMDFKRAAEDTVKRDGLTGTRWRVTWNENGIVYSAVIEIFGVGDDYYRVTTLAPEEVYDRYSETFEDVLRSVQFPMLRVNPQLLDHAK